MTTDTVSIYVMCNGEQISECYINENEWGNYNCIDYFEVDRRGQVIRDESRNQKSLWDKLDVLAAETFAN